MLIFLGYKAIFSDVIKNITRVNSVLEDLIKNYEKLNKIYKSQESQTDYSSDGEVDQVFKENFLKSRNGKGIMLQPTKSPELSGTAMFFSEEHAEKSDSEDEAVIQPKKEEKPKTKGKLKSVKKNAIDYEEDRVGRKPPPVQLLKKNDKINTETTKKPSTDNKQGQSNNNKNINKNIKKDESEEESDLSTYTEEQLEPKHLENKQNKTKDKNQSVNKKPLPKQNSTNKKVNIPKNDHKSTGESDGSTANSESVSESESKETPKNLPKDQPIKNKSQLLENIVLKNSNHKIPKNKSVYRTVKTVIKAEEFSNKNIWNEVVHKPVQLNTEKETLYYNQPKIYFRNLNNRMQNTEVLPSKLKHKKHNQTVDSNEDDKGIMKEQFKTRILRKAYGDACLKVVVKKCYKASKAAYKRASNKYKCTSAFKSSFQTNAKNGCIKEFGEQEPSVSAKESKPTGDRDFQDITRNGYLAAACLPSPKTETIQRRSSNDTVPSTNTKIEKQLNILRDRFERACQKASGEKCNNACTYGATQACNSHSCIGKKLNDFKKECRRECKKAYKSGSHQSSSKTGSSSSSSESSESSRSKHSRSSSRSSSGSSEGSGSSSEDTTTTTTTTTTEATTTTTAETTTTTAATTTTTAATTTDKKAQEKNSEETKDNKTLRITAHRSKSQNIFSDQEEEYISRSKHLKISKLARQKLTTKGKYSYKHRYTS